MYYNYSKNKLNYITLKIIILDFKDNNFVLQKGYIPIFPQLPSSQGFR
jgi:hypothetical protein